MQRRHRTPPAARILLATESLTVAGRVNPSVADDWPSVFRPGLMMFSRSTVRSFSFCHGRRCRTPGRSSWVSSNRSPLSRRSTNGRLSAHCHRRGGAAPCLRLSGPARPCRRPAGCHEDRGRADAFSMRRPFPRWRQTSRHQWSGHRGVRARPACSTSPVVASVCVDQTVLCELGMERDVHQSRQALSGQRERPQCGCVEHAIADQVVCPVRSVTSMLPLARRSRGSEECQAPRMRSPATTTTRMR